MNTFFDTSITVDMLFSWRTSKFLVVEYNSFCVIAHTHCSHIMTIYDSRTCNVCINVNDISDGGQIPSPLKDSDLAFSEFVNIQNSFFALVY